MNRITSNETTDIMNDVRRNHGIITNPISIMGTYFDKPLTSGNEAIVKSGLNFNVEKLPLYDQSGKMLPVYGTFRMDTMDFLGSCGGQYTPIQNSECFTIPDAIVNNPEIEAKYVSAGCYKNGAKVYVVARVPQLDISVGMDKSEAYLIFANCHDRTGSFKIMIMYVRLVCMNGLVKIVDTKTCLSVKHIKSASDKLFTVKNEISKIFKQKNVLEQDFTSLSRKLMTPKSFTNVMSGVFGDKWNTSKMQAKRTIEVASLFRNNDNNAFPEQKGTAWSMFNAITNYVDHGQWGPKTQVENKVFGSGAALKKQALEIVLEETKRAPNLTDVKLKSDKSTVDNILNSVTIPSTNNTADNILKMMAY